MTLLEEVKKARQQGISEDRIIQALRESGAQYRDISDALAQSRIQEAVTSSDEIPQSKENTINQNMQIPEPSAPAPSPESQETGYYQPPVENYEGYQEQYPQQYQQYPQQESTNSLINEIAEQIVSEKMDETRKQIDKILDMKSTVQARVESVDERLKRIEKIIDTLQSSVLRKVGDYVTNVEDIKQELIETQKTFAGVASKAHQKKNKK